MSTGSRPRPRRAAAATTGRPAPGEAPAATEAGAVRTCRRQRSGDSARTRGTAAATCCAAGLLAAGLLGALAAERRRRRGSTPDPEALEAEVALRVGADPDRAARLDRALRGLSATCRTGRPRCPRCSPRRRRRRDRPAARPGPPGRPCAVDPRRRGTGLAAAPRRRRRSRTLRLGHAPFPGLVCVGRDLEGRDVLVDLESVGGVVSVTGDDHVAAEVVSALAVQLATNAWTDAQQVTGHGLAPVLADLAGDRLRLVDDVEPLLAEVSRSAARPRRRRRAHRPPGPAARGGPGLPGARRPRRRRELAERLVGAHRVGLAGLRRRLRRYGPRHPLAPRGRRERHADPPAARRTRGGGTADRALRRAGRRAVRPGAHRAAPRRRAGSR